MLAESAIRDTWKPQAPLKDNEGLAQSATNLQNRKGSFHCVTWNAPFLSSLFSLLVECCGAVQNLLIVFKTSIPFWIYFLPVPFCYCSSLHIFLALKLWVLPLGWLSYARPEVSGGPSCQKLFATQKIVVADNNIIHKVLFQFTKCHQRNYFTWYSEQPCEVDCMGSMK